MKLPFEVKETKQAIIFIGIQASGKSTFYHTFLEQLGYCHINLDTLNTRNKENILMENCFREGKSFVIDNTNPEMTDREKYISKAKENGYEIIGIYFQSILCDCIARNMKRKNAVPVCAILARRTDYSCLHIKKALINFTLLALQGVHLK